MTATSPVATQIISVSASNFIELTAEAISSIPIAMLAVTRFVNRGTKTATPKGAARSRKRPYVPVAAPAFFVGISESTTLIKIVALAPSPKPRIQSEAASSKTEVTGENRSIKAHPIPVMIKDTLKIRFGSNLSASGPRRIEPRDIPIYIIDIAYPDITVFSG